MALLIYPSIQWVYLVQNNKSLDNVVTEIEQPTVKIKISGEIKKNLISI